METKKQVKEPPSYSHSKPVLLVRNEYCQTSPLGGLSLSVLSDQPPSVTSGDPATEVHTARGWAAAADDVIVMIEGVAQSFWVCICCLPSLKSRL